MARSWALKLGGMILLGWAMLPTCGQAQDVPSAISPESAVGADAVIGRSQAAPAPVLTNVTPAPSPTADAPMLDPAVLPDLTRAALIQFFVQAHVPTPDGIKVDVATDVSPIAIEVTLTTDHPDSVVVEARHFVERDLEAHGFVFDLNSAANDPRIPAHLAITTAPLPVRRGFAAFDPRSFHDFADVKARLLPLAAPILVFSALILGSVAAFSMALVMTRELFRRRPREKAMQRAEQAARAELKAADKKKADGDAGRPAVGPVVVSAFDANPASTNQKIESLTSEQPEQTAAPQPMSAALERAASQIEQMPFDQAMRLLASVGPAERVALFDRLKLQQSVRQRLERELEAGRLGAPLGQS